MTEHTPYVPSEEEIKKAEDSMGVRDRLMSDMREDDFEQAVSSGAIDTISNMQRLEKDKWLINGHTVNIHGHGMSLSIDDKVVDGYVLEAFWRKYGAATKIAAPYATEQYANLAEKKIYSSPDLINELNHEKQMRDERLNRLSIEERKASAIATLEQLLG